ncbi:MAG: metal-dependent hydrolase [Chloroflexi bacterium]|nr:metal-dependent hydrolase [Chloroflexota bacterium]
MIFDCHAYLGNYPFRPLCYNTGASLVELMDREGIDQAAVGSLNALYYRDVQAANEELAQEVTGRRDRLVPLATLNPAYPGCDHDFARCFGPLDMHGLVLCPTYHGYALDDPPALALMARAANQGLPVFLRVQVEDPRKQHRLVQVPNIPVEQIASAVRKLPQARFVLLDMGGEIAQLLELLDDQRNIYADFCRAEVFSYWDFSVGWLVEKLGADHILFGTGMPFNVPRISQVKLEALDLPPDDFARIAGENLAQLFKMR